ncbi:MAG: glycosyltransferase family 4 protein [Caldilineales bacterium]
METQTPVKIRGAARSPSVSEKSNFSGASFAGLTVCVVGPHYPRPGGVSTQVEMLESCLRDEGATVRPVDTNVQPLRRLGRLGRWLLPAAQVVLVPARLWRAVGGADIIHAHLASYWGFYLPMLAVTLIGKLRGVPSVATYHGGKAGEFAAAHSTSVGALLRRLDALIVLSLFTGRVFEGLGLAPVVIPNVIDQQPFRAAPPGPGSPRLANPDRPALLWVKSFDDSGNPGLMIEAFARLRRGLPGATLTMVGDGPRLPDVREQAEALAAPVHFAGRVPYSAMARAYDTADILVISSAVDNQPNVLIEGSACGLPVVATAVGGIPDMVHDGVNALLVAPGDANALAETILRVASDPELASHLGQAAVENAQRYTWARVRGPLAVLYDRVLRQRLGCEPA